MWGKSPSATGATASRSSRCDGALVLSGLQPARRLGLDDRAHQGGHHAGVRLHRLLGRLVAGHRRPEDEAPLVRVRQGPRPQGARHGQPTRRVALARRRPAARRLAGRPLGLVGQRLVGGEDQRARGGRRARRSSGTAPRAPSRGPGRWSAGTGRPHPPGRRAGGPRPGSPPSSPPAPAPGPSVALTWAPVWLFTRGEHKYLTRTLFTLSINVHEPTHAGGRHDTEPRPAEQPATAHYKKPDWFTRNVLNRPLSGLTRLGVSVMGSRVLEHRGRTTRQAAPHAGEPAHDRRDRVPGRPTGRDPVGPQRAARRRPPGADPRPAAPAVHGHRGPRGRQRADPARLPAPLEVRGGDVLRRRVTPDSTDEEWAAVAARHPVFVAELSTRLAHRVPVPATAVAARHHGGA